MKRHLEPAFFLFAMACLFAGCGLTQKQAADITQVTVDIACAIENAELNDAAIKEVCVLADDAFDRVKPALAQHRRGLTVVEANTRGVTRAECTK